MSFLNALRVHNFVAKTTMLWTRLFLTRLKRRPNLSVRAAFQVNSSAVFKEDVDIVPVIIDDTLSYMVGRRQQYAIRHTEAHRGRLRYTLTSERKNFRIATPSA